jgi:hypothetical protein
MAQTSNRANVAGGGTRSQTRTVVLGWHRHTHQAALFDREQDCASGLYPDASLAGEIGLLVGLILALKATQQRQTMQDAEQVFAGRPACALARAWREGSYGSDALCRYVPNGRSSSVRTLSENAGR